MTLTMTAAVPHLSMKRPAPQDFIDTTESPLGNDEDSAHPSPMTLLNTLTAAAAAKKLRTDDLETSPPDSHVNDNDSVKDSEPANRASDRINGALPIINGPTGFPCVWLNGNEPCRDPEGGEKSPNPPPPQLALPHETEGASTERALHLSPRSPGGETGFPSSGHTFLDRSKHLSINSPAPQPLVIQPIESPVKSLPRNPFEGRPGLEALFKAGQTTPQADVEGGEAAEVCPQCHKVFKRKVYLQRHMEREHWSTAKVFKCEDCSYETKHQSNLSVHRRTHTGERPYHCGACGQRYTQGHLLKSHIRSRHAGNMEFYNLDKKSDSTRGRKSLDIKHELGGTPKVDKISALLQAAATGNGGPRSQILPPPMPKFGNLLTPPMGGLPYFGGLRPMVTPMSLANTLLGSPRFFSLPGMDNGHLPHSPLLGNGGLPLLADPASMNPAANLLPMGVVKKEGRSGVKKEHLTSSGIKLPLKVPEQELLEGFPQDLSIKRRVQSPKKSSSPAMFLPLPVPIHTGSQTGPISHASTTVINSVPFPFSLNSALQTPPSLHHPPLPVAKYTDFYDETLKENTPVYINPSSNNNEKSTVKSSNPAPTKRSCNDDKCTHLEKLKNLRRNVFRMLSTFTPDLSDENGISNDGDDVDELLHEVIYSNIEEDFLAGKD